MKILVLNSGSSSIKYQLFEMPSQRVVCSGLVERIGLTQSRITHTAGETKIVQKSVIATHTSGLERISKLLMDSSFGVIKSPEEIQAVGHRVVHGGSSFSDTVLITKQVKDKIKKLFSLAPLHNPANYEGIVVAEEVFKKAKQVAVFDTAFHQTISPKAYTYAIPKDISDKYRIRLYGFHGTSHKYVSQKAIDYLGKTDTKIISIHLGNGCSMTAIADGKSIDHSLGFAPMNGLIMGTRSGDIDPSILFYLISRQGYTLEEVHSMLNKKSGMLGLTGYSDLRDIENAAEKGEAASVAALQMYAYRIKKFIGAYTVALGGLDALIFTAGVGENSDVVRRLVCSDMEFLGVELDLEKNQKRTSGINEINTTTSKVKVLVIPTNEELEIAKQTYELLHK